MNGRRTEGPGRHPGVLVLLVLLVLLPLLATALVSGAQAVSAWTFREDAGHVSKDATELATIASARTELSVAETPVAAVSFASEEGLSEAVLGAILHVDYPAAIARSEAIVRSTPTYLATPILRADRAAFLEDIPLVQEGSIPYAVLSPVIIDFGNDLDSYWFSRYQRLQDDVTSWSPPGSFETQVAGLRLAYESFLAASGEIEDTSYVLGGQGGDAAKQALIRYQSEFDTTTSGLSAELGPLSEKQWVRIRSDAADRRYVQTIQQAVDLSFGDTTPPWLADPASAGPVSADGLQYLEDVGALARDASQDLHVVAGAQAAAANHRFVRDVLLLLALVLVSLGGVFLVGNTLTRPLRKLATSALKIRNGEFDLEKLPEQGPRELVTTIEAFNDMTSTLKGVELKVTALAEEDLSHAELSMPLPGRTGQALQSVVEQLTERIRERELQRERLYEEATHDRLTGLLNRSAVLGYLETDVSRRRSSGESVAVIFVDLDGLKTLNDAYGHHAGDAAIVATAEAIVAAMGGRGVVGRLGGDEFLAVLGADESRTGRSIADRISRFVGVRSIQVDGVRVPLQASVGIAVAECDQGTDPAELVRMADEAMYEAKAEARSARYRSGVGGTASSA